ncbi:MAG: endopeptidase La [Actinobacteria bacterium]|nr:endopeptidase La [Actinomycetota bacterium]
MTDVTDPDRSLLTSTPVLSLPVLPLPTVVLPGTLVTLALDNDAVRLAVEAAAAGDGRVLLVAPVAAAGGQSAHPSAAPLTSAALGVVARVPSRGSLPGGQPAAIVQAEGRARILARHTSDRGADHADVEVLTDPRPTPRVEAVARELRVVLEEIAKLRQSRRLPEILRTIAEPGALADAVVTWSEVDGGLRDQVLHAVELEARLQLVADWARDHLAELQVTAQIRADVTEGVDKQQRDYLLRQQLAAIRKELGEGDDDVVGEYRSKLEAIRPDLADKVASFIDKEIDRLERMSQQSPEHSWVRTWLDRILELPWATRTPDQLELATAREILDADHYGLDDVKDRIVEFLAVRKLRADRDVAEQSRAAGTVVTLVGPPGVGKTSLGESIARAMGRNFVRVALGGVRDEAEIRGHRRTYVGSQPGRIARAIIEAGSMNPVVLLDEVDKLSAGGWSGDPTAALLEVLDPAQNHTFRDHYLEVELDLSQVVFIATANVADSIPAPLLDRMELVRLDGYTEDEKVFIAERYLLPRQLERSGLQADEVAVTEAALRTTITGYTREAGVRSLERELGKLSRKVAAAVATGKRTAPIEVDSPEVRDWLGRPKVDDEVPERTNVPGVATGLAVTGSGGDVLFIETTAFPLAGDAATTEPTLTLTGQLGDVMKESAHIALSYVRSHAEELGVDPATLAKRVHVHVPAGAVPKDGPSAGVTMTTALVSLLTGKVVKPTVGMTGEITLQGKVLPIGGVKQKVLAAHRAGLTEVVLPKRNGPDLDDVPEKVREVMTFHLADTYADVLAAAFA